MAQLTAGSPAPDFTLVDQHGETAGLGDHKGHKVLVFFYPRASTPGCTTQACGLRISPDLPDKLEKFDAKHGLGFTLLSDPEHQVAEAYGVWGEKKLYGKVYMGIIRSAFLIDEQGQLEQVWYKISPKDTPVKLLKALGG